MITAKTIIVDALDEFDVEAFIDPDFNAMAADKIIADLEFRGLRIVQFERLPLPEPDGKAQP